MTNINNYERYKDLLKQYNTEESQNVINFIDEEIKNIKLTELSKSLIPKIKSILFYIFGNFDFIYESRNRKIIKLNIEIIESDYYVVIYKSDILSKKYIIRNKDDFISFIQNYFNVDLKDIEIYINKEKTNDIYKLLNAYKSYVIFSNINPTTLRVQYKIINGGFFNYSLVDEDIYESGVVLNDNIINNFNDFQNKMEFYLK